MWMTLTKGIESFCLTKDIVLESTLGAVYFVVMVKS